MIRKLKKEDAPLMLEWMHDDEVLKGLREEVFRKKTLLDCIQFIENSFSDTLNCHRAIVDDKDNYVGTVSLKHIDEFHKDAEFAIVLLRSEWGKGYAFTAMKEILVEAFLSYHLEEVYWNVLRDNKRAIQLYDKIAEGEVTAVCDRWMENAPRKKNGEYENVAFYHITKGKYLR